MTNAKRFLATLLRRYGNSHISRCLASISPVWRLDRSIHDFVLHFQPRYQWHTKTQFLRNRPQLEAICRLARMKAPDASMRIAVVACSSGPEVYSLLWLLRAARPDLAISALGIDISEDAICTARRGTYRLDLDWMMKGLTNQELDALFEEREGLLSIRREIAAGIEWRVDDASRADLVHDVGQFDLVLANKFLINLPNSIADRALRNVISMVSTNGYLVVTGVDLQLKMRNIRAYHLLPIHDLMEEIWTSDTIACNDWPWEYYALEPLDKNRSDWEIRYATIFKRAGI